MSNMPEFESSNPLQKFFRQPKFFLVLPSKGNYYPNGALNMPESGELAVFPMTAKDELTMQTPDALLNGQATVDVIKSCIPDIIDPWRIPTIDMDAILIAIRMASYGNTLDVTINLPGSGEERDFCVDMEPILQGLMGASFNDIVEIGDLKIKLTPISYKSFTENSLKSFEEQRIFAAINNDKLSETQKLEKFNESFKKLTNINMSIIINSIDYIEVGGEKVTNKKHIEEFLDKSDKSYFKAIKDHLSDEKQKFEVKPFKAYATEEDIEKGVPAEFEIPITFDQSNFFG